MSLFTPVSGLIGGSLIGMSAGALLLFNGNVMGISGIIFNGLGNPIASLKDSKQQWRWVFLASFALAVNLYVNYLGPVTVLADVRSTDIDVPIPSLVGHLVGGFFVGAGTVIGNGCTTGHGICGLGRLNPRNLVAVLSFTGTSILTRALTSPLRSWSAYTDILRTSTLPQSSPIVSAIFMSSLVLPALARPAALTTIDGAKTLGAAISGVLFAAGLAVSGMTKNSKVHDFLCFSNIARNNYDPTLMTVMASAIAASWASYQFVKGFGSNGKMTCPLSGGDFSGIPRNKAIDSRLLIGTMVFGFGWGLTGICPGPGLYAASAGVIDAIIGWLPAFLLGSHVGKAIVKNVWEASPSDTKKKL